MNSGNPKDSTFHTRHLHLLSLTEPSRISIKFEIAKSSKIHHSSSCAHLFDHCRSYSSVPKFLSFKTNSMQR